ncbi:MAG: phage tail sheath C-terminal domain-containing protein [Acidobacteriota bacterium]
MLTYLHPGVYVEEIPSGSKPIEGVATSVAAFVGHTTRGPIDTPVLIHQWSDYEDTFGGVLSATDALGLAVSAFYLNGGKSAYIGRLAADAVAASSPDGSILGSGDAASVDVLKLSATSPGAWGNTIAARITKNDARSFRLEVGRWVDSELEVEEVFDNLSMNERDANHALAVINSSSQLITAALGSETVSHYETGRSYTQRVNNQIPWTTVSEGMQLTLSVNGLAAQTVTLGPAPDGGSAYADGDEVLAELQTRIRELSEAPGDAYDGFLCFFANTGPVEDARVYFQTGSTGSHMAIKVHPGELASILTLGVAAGGGEFHGSRDVVPEDATVDLVSGDDGVDPGVDEYRAFFAELEKVRDVSMVVLPGQHQAADGSGNPNLAAALAHCERTKSRVLIMDPPPATELASGADVEAMNLPTSSYSTLYYPWVRVSNPFYNADTNPTAPTTLTIAPSAFAAGMWSKTDGRRGVWKAPAGVETSLLGLAGLEYVVEDGEQDQLNPLGVNCLRTLPGFGSVVWGSRTLATRSDPEWRYVPVRRTAIFIERSVYEGIQWAVFEPNNHLLWSALRANVGAFMDGLFRAGAFQGEKASDAYFVRCGLGDTMTQADIDRGRVIAIVGFAPLKPAEFVIIRIQQKVGQA